MYGFLFACFRWTKWPRWNIRGNGGWYFFKPSHRSHLGYAYTGIHSPFSSYILSLFIIITVYSMYTSITDSLSFLRMLFVEEKNTKQNHKRHSCHIYGESRHQKCLHPFCFDDRILRFCVAFLEGSVGVLKEDRLWRPRT